MSVPPRTEPLSGWEKVTEAIGWAVAVVWSTVANLGRLWSGSGSGDRVVILVEAALSAAAAGLFVLTGWDLGWLLIGVLLFARLVAELVRISRAIAERARMERALAEHPTGAPRIAVVHCAHGEPFRFGYGPTGWEYLGPATASEAARAH